MKVKEAAKYVLESSDQSEFNSRCSEFMTSLLNDSAKKLPRKKPVGTDGKLAAQFQAVYRDADARWKSFAHRVNSTDSEFDKVHDGLLRYTVAEFHPDVAYIMAWPVLDRDKIPED